MKENCKNEKVLQVVRETEILGKKILMYGSIEFPYFIASDVADWIDYAKNPNGSRQTSKMVKLVDDDEKLVVKVLLPDDDQVRECIALTEDGLYECCMRSTKPVAKEMKREIKNILNLFVSLVLLLTMKRKLLIITSLLFQMI